MPTSRYQNTDLRFSMRLGPGRHFFPLRPMRTTDARDAWSAAVNRSRDFGISPRVPGSIRSFIHTDSFSPNAVADIIQAAQRPDWIANWKKNQLKVGAAAHES